MRFSGYELSWSRPVTNTLWCTPLLHPAHITRGRWNAEEAQQNALARLVEVVKAGGEPPQWDTSQPPEGAWIYPSLSQLTDWRGEFTTAGHDAVVYDLETAGDHIICVGMMGLTLETGARGRGLCLRFRLREGRRYWPNPREHCLAVEFLSRFLDDPTVATVVHNGVSFDIPLLMEHGFRVRGPIVDTMVLSSRAYAEMPKGLQFLATRYLWAPCWKTMTDETDEPEGKA